MKTYHCTVRATMFCPIEYTRTLAKVPTQNFLTPYPMLQPEILVPSKGNKDTGQRCKSKSLLPTTKSQPFL